MLKKFKNFKVTSNLKVINSIGFDELTKEEKESVKPYDIYTPQDLDFIRVDGKIYNVQFLCDSYFDRELSNQGLIFSDYLCNRNCEYNDYDFALYMLTENVGIIFLTQFKDYSFNVFHFSSL
jgi:hypothetical protein